MLDDDPFSSLPPLVASPSPQGGVEPAAAGGVETPLDPDPKRGYSVRDTVVDSDKPVVVETVTDTDSSVGYEGKRPASLLNDFLSEVVPKEESKDVTSLKPSPTNRNKATRVAWLQKRTCSKYCLAKLTSKTGLPKFCIEPLEEGKCKMVSHAQKGVFEPEDGFYVMSETTSGRGGATAYMSKFLPEALISPELGAELLLKEQTVEEWETDFKKMKVVEVVGGEIEEDRKDKIMTGGYKLLQDCYTPQKTVKVEASGLSPTIASTPDSWEDVWGTWEAGSNLGDPSAGAPRDATSVPRGTAYAYKSFVVCKENFEQLADTIDMLKEKSSKTFRETFDKINVAALSILDLQELVGVYSEIEDAEGVTTVFEAITVLDGRLARLKQDVLNWTPTIDSLKDRLDKLDLNKSDILTRLTGVKDQVGAVTGKTTSVESAVQRVRGQLNRMMDEYLKPFTRLYNRMMAKDMSGQDFVERMSRVEQTVAQLADDNDLFGSVRVAGCDAGIGSVDLSSATSKMTEIQEANAKLRKELDELKDLVGALGNANSTKGGDGDDPIWEQITNRLTSLEEYKGPGIVVAGIGFGGPMDCEKFLRTQLCWDDSKPFFCNDWISLVHSVPKEDGQVSLEALMARDHHATKGGFSNLSAAKAYASAQQSVPGILAGTADHPLPGCKTFDHFDNQDGLKGVRYEVTRGVDNRSNALMSLMQRDLRAHPIGLSVFTYLVLNGQIHWKTYAAMLSDLRNISYQQCHDSTEAWLYACEVGRGVFDECYKLRNVGSERSNMKEFTVQDGARLMWGMIQTHQLMEEFVKHKFLGHPKLSSYSINHLFRNRVTPHGLATVKGDVSKLTSRVSTVESTTNKHENRLNAIKKRGGDKE